MSNPNTSSTTPATVVKTNDEVYIPEDQKIPDPKMAVFNHTVMKGIQVGGFLGALYTPIHFATRKYILKKPLPFSLMESIKVKLPRFISIGTSIGFLMTAVMYYGKTRNFTQNNFDDRAFRIAHNKMNLFWDQIWVASVLGSSIAFALMKKPLITGPMIGSAIGTPLFAALWPIKQKLD